MDNPDVTTRPQQPPVPRFRNIDDDGKVVESIKPFPVITELEAVYYHSTIANTNFIREDGLRLAFRNHIFKTNLLHDKRYLDNEIVDGNRYVRLATLQEIDAYEMSRDPATHIRQKVESELRNDSDFMQRLEAEIRLKLQMEASNMAAAAVNSAEPTFDHSNGKDGSPHWNKKVEQSGSGINMTVTEPAPVIHQTKLGGVVTTKNLTAASVTSDSTGT